MAYSTIETDGVEFTREATSRNTAQGLIRPALVLLILAWFTVLTPTDPDTVATIVPISDAAAAGSEQALDDANTDNSVQPVVSEEADTLLFQAAPKLSESDYPRIQGVNSRVAVWLAAQLHLWFAALVLAVPIFVFIIEAIGMCTRDHRYDEMAYEFIKVSITAYSLTAILGGLLAFFLLLFYPHVFTYLSTIFKGSMFYYALLFFVESAVLYLYYYGWHWLQGGFKKWVHLTLGLLLNAAGTTLMFLANAWAHLHDESCRRGCGWGFQRRRMGSHS